MAGKSNIEWTEQTSIVDRCGRRVRYYRRRRPETPGARLRRDMAEKGLAWCRDCQAWLAAGLVSRGRCRPHHNADARVRYATNESYRAERRKHAHFRKFGVDAVPVVGRENLTHAFRGECAYCDAQAETWDHVVPVTKGGETVPENMLPACVVCNSSKKDRDLFAWLDATGRTLKVLAAERLAHYQVVL